LLLLDRQSDMDFNELERIITEEVTKALGERQRAEEASLPPDQNVTLDANACQGPACSAPIPPSIPTVSLPAPLVKPAEPTPPPKLEGPAILLLFTGAREKWDVLAEAMRQWREAGVRLDGIFSDSAKYVISSDEVEALGIRTIDQPNEVREIIYDMSRYSSVFIPSISRTHAAKLAIGITDSLTLNMTISALAQKANVVASNDGLEPTACVVCGNQVPGIQDVLDKYREQLAKMGMKLMPAEDAVKEVFSVTRNRAESGSDLITSLLTEEDAAQISGPVVKASRGGLITPLALELLHKRGIEVIIVPQSRERR